MPARKPATHPSSSNFTPPTPSCASTAESAGPCFLELVSQESYTSDTFSLNGDLKKVHVVIKNNTFKVQVRAKEGLNLADVVIEAVLMYDQSPPREVGYIRAKPLEYRSDVSDGVASIEAMIKVLSSQHEGSNFLLRVRALDAKTGQTIPENSRPLFSAPINVISKPEVLRPKAQKAKKRTQNDIVLEKLAHLEELQREHNKRFESFLTTTKDNSTPPALHCSSSLSPSTPAPASVTFEDAFENMLKVFSSLDKSERSTKMRKVLSKQTLTDTFCDLLDTAMYGDVMTGKDASLSQSLSFTSTPRESVWAQTSHDVTSLDGTSPTTDSTASPLTDPSSPMLARALSIGSTGKQFKLSLGDSSSFVSLDSTFTDDLYDLLPVQELDAL